MSLPLWERGLKCYEGNGYVAKEESLPLWERGLKSEKRGRSRQKGCRSPCGSVD